MATVAQEVDRLLAQGKSVTVTVTEDREYLSPQQVADRLGFSCQHVVRLINTGEIQAQKLAKTAVSVQTTPRGHWTSWAPRSCNVAQRALV